MRLMPMPKTILILIASVASRSQSGLRWRQSLLRHASGKMECSQIYAKLNLTPEQKTKLDAFQAPCEKDGCTEESMEKFFARSERRPLA